jgi:Spy/CpxP family protein refolding chaperone
MRVLVLAAAMAAVALPASTASAQRWGGGYHHDRGDYRELRREQRECRRELRRADSRREYRRELRECRRELREARRDYRDDYRDHRRYRDHDDRLYWDGYRWRSRW